jgi:dimethylargininase
VRFRSLNGTKELMLIWRRNYGNVSMPSARYAIVRPVPDSYDLCVRTNIERIDVDLAQKQHAEYCRVLHELGLKLIWARGDNTLPDSCFVEDTAVVFGEKAIICNMKVKSRVKEVIEVAKALGKLKVMYYIKPPATIDGGDVLRVEDKVLVGLSNRTNLQAISQLERILEGTKLKIFSVKVQDALHLKSACTYLGNNYVILAERCFAKGIPRDFKKIVVPPGEEYAADCLAVNGTVLVAKGFSKTKELIQRKGFVVKELEMSEFRKGEGALTCLSIIC